MFTDERFNEKQSVDKRGRQVKSESGENLRRFYDLDNDENEEEESSESSSEEEEDEEVQTDVNASENVEMSKL